MCFVAESASWVLRAPTQERQQEQGQGHSRLGQGSASSSTADGAQNASPRVCKPLSGRLSDPASLRLQAPRLSLLLRVKPRASIATMRQKWKCAPPCRPLLFSNTHRESSPFQTTGNGGNIQVPCQSSSGAGVGQGREVPVHDGCFPNRHISAP